MKKMLAFATLAVVLTVGAATVMAIHPRPALACATNNC
jgi:hypothetical protein